MAKKTKSAYTKDMCDKLLTPIIKDMYPNCLLCGGKTQVAHHHFHKSKSMCLRYNLKNLIPLCNGCHLKLGFDESRWGCKILVIKGIKWFKDLEAYHIKHKDDKPNFEEIYKKLSKLI